MFMSEIYTHRGQRVSPRPPRLALQIERAQALIWFVLTVKPCKEDAVEQILREHGVTTVIPKIARRHARRFKGTRNNPPLLRPMLPGYVIAGFSGAPNWFAVRKQHLITGVLGVRGVPKTADREGVARMSLIGGDGVISTQITRKTAAEIRGFDTGDRARVLDGPFEGFVVDVGSIDGKFARCGVSIFGRSTEIEMNIGNLVGV